MICFLRYLPFAAAFAVSFPALAAGPTGYLNDTGQTTCDDGANNMVACAPLYTGDAATAPRQDARFGRDAAAGAGALAKTGGGAGGFDFSRMCMNGELAGQGTCPANPSQGTNATDWACTVDNVTNLAWSIDSSSGDWTTYATTTYPAATNDAGRCGFSSGWRLPTLRELLSIVHSGTYAPAIDSAYFPGTAASWHWTADSSAADATAAWTVGFWDGFAAASGKTSSAQVRLVHNRP